MAVVVVMVGGGWGSTGIGIQAAPCGGGLFMISWLSERGNRIIDRE